MRESRRPRPCVVKAAGEQESGSGGMTRGGETSGVITEAREGVGAEGGLPAVGSGRRSRRRSRAGGSDDTGSGKEERRGAGNPGKEGSAGRRKWLPKEPEAVREVKADDRTAVRQQEKTDQRSGWKAAQEPLEPATLGENDAEFGERGGSGSGEAERETPDAAEYRRMERSFGERAQEMDPEEIRLARQRVADLIRAGDDVEQEIVRMGREGFLTDTLILVIQNRLNFARHDNERHVVQCLDLLLRRIEAEREAQEATPALRLLNTLLHLADDLSADISTSGYDQWQREARDAMRAVFLPEDPFTVAMPVANGMGAPTWNEMDAKADLGSSMGGGESTLLRIDFIRELEELLEIVEADAAAAAQFVAESLNLSLDPQQVEAEGSAANVEQDGGSWGDLDADKVALKLRLEERLRIISRVRDLQHIAATLNL
ncbi:hypothetical protein CLOM_g22072 [Closterium sp. NIES-68]|nr:hypothetical protein CLOM_g22072 [Closterium sp. NIES-68]GJP63112.1 hypothetical protein CLOP_g20191 [Closterium sp. NIES-67]